MSLLGENVINFVDPMNDFFNFSPLGWNMLPPKSPPITIMRPTMAPSTYKETCACQCRNGECLKSFNQICDGILNCKDGSDESNCGNSGPGKDINE